MKLFCPKCGTQTANPGPPPWNGDIYVVTDIGGDCDYYAAAVPYTCSSCKLAFFLDEKSEE